jgi:class 3 adenylate cyclase
MPPETRYAVSHGSYLAYQRFGEGDVDLVLVPTSLSNIELTWEHPDLSAFLRRLGRFARVIHFDRRGNGMSDGARGTLTLEEQVDDVRAVLAAAGSEEAAVLAGYEAAGLAVLFAAGHPDTVRGLVLATPMPRLLRGPGYEWAQSEEERDRRIRDVVEHWGEDSPANPWLELAGPDPASRAAMARYQRLASGPGDAAAVMMQNASMDVRGVLPSIQCPTLVMRRRGERFMDERHTRYVVEHIPGARYVELSGDQPVWIGDPEEPAREVESFLTGARPPLASERVLATVLFTDIVGSTDRATAVGDARWTELLRRHDELVRTEVRRRRGRVVKTLGDGALAVFDGPSRAVDCALALRDGTRRIGLSMRAGLHTGECELMPEDDIGGVAVHIAARIAALAGEDEVLTSGTVKDLTVGGPFALTDRGERRLKGVDGSWRLFAAR